MNKARSARIARLVALRQQQRRVREARHAAAQRKVGRAEARRQDCASRCEALDLEHDSHLRREMSPLDLELLGEARSHAVEDRRVAENRMSEATKEADDRREELLVAHRDHRSLEIYHDKMDKNFKRDTARTEQRELDDIANRANTAKRAWR